MKVIVIGATGLVGNATVKELSDRDHEVIAIARNTEKVHKSSNVKPLALDVQSPKLIETLRDCDAVISAFNAGWTNPNYVEDFKKGYNAILEASKKAQVPYVLIVGGAGSLYVAPNLQLVDTPDFPKDVYPGANSARELLNELKSRKDINWAFLSPAAMFAVAPVSFERSGKYRIGKDDVLTNSDGTPADISVADLAIALVDDIEKKSHLFERFTVASVE